eukprot:3940397-Rhodomonas_salina.2
MSGTDIPYGAICLLYLPVRCALGHAQGTVGTELDEGEDKDGADGYLASYLLLCAGHLAL